jgi:hypothetical protein
VTTAGWDLRLTESGEIYVIEVNASCYLERTGEFASAAASAGIEYPELINRIVECAVKRYEHAPLKIGSKIGNGRRRRHKQAV